MEMTDAKDAVLPAYKHYPKIPKRLLFTGAAFPDIPGIEVHILGANKAEDVSPLIMPDPFVVSATKIA